MFLLVLLAVELPLRDRWKEVGTSGALYLLIFFSGIWILWKIQFLNSTQNSIMENLEIHLVA